MAEVIRVTLPGYEALTDTNIDHYALYSDQDYVLIKEQSRGTIVVPNISSATVNHNLGYVPFVAGFFYPIATGAGYYWLCGVGRNFCSLAITTTQAIFTTGNSGGNTNVYYYIFYDNYL